MPFDASPQVEVSAPVVKPGPVEETLRRAKVLIPTESVWWQGSRKGGQRCPLIAIGQASVFQSARLGAVRYLEDVIEGGSIPTWNDCPSRKFHEIQAAFDRAIELAAREGV